METHLYNIYSGMLGGFISMGHETEESALLWIKNYHCDIEKQRMTVTKG